MGAPIERVHVLMTDQPRPVYHRLDTVVFDPEASGQHVALMSCGVRTERTWWDATLRREHADLFCRPCARCFGGAA